MSAIRESIITCVVDKYSEEVYKHNSFTPIYKKLFYQFKSEIRNCISGEFPDTTFETLRIPSFIKPSEQINRYNLQIFFDECCKCYKVDNYDSTY